MLAFRDGDGLHDVTLADRINNFLTITHNLTKNGVLAIQPRGFYMGNEEL